mgnify:CR=1 FL=1
MTDLLTTEEYKAIAAGLDLSGNAFIDGAFRPAASRKTIPTVNPATGEVIGEVTEADEPTVARALDDARTLRRTGVKSVHDIGDDDGWDDDFEDDEDGPEIIYVRD